MNKKCRKSKTLGTICNYIYFSFVSVSILQHAGYFVEVMLNSVYSYIALSHKAGAAIVIVYVLASIVAYFICKWLDRDE